MVIFATYYTVNMRLELTTFWVFTDQPYMLNIQSHVSLKPYNTFGIEASARYWVSIRHEDDLQTLLSLPEFSDSPRLVIGGGSNILLCHNVDGLVIKVALP